MSRHCKVDRGHSPITARREGPLPQSCTQLLRQKTLGLKTHGHFPLDPNLSSGLSRLTKKRTW